MSKKESAEENMVYVLSSMRGYLTVGSSGRRANVVKLAPGLNHMLQWVWDSLASEPALKRMVKAKTLQLMPAKKAKGMKSNLAYKHSKTKPKESRDANRSDRKRTSSNRGKPNKGRKAKSGKRSVKRTKSKRRKARHKSAK